MLLQSNIELFGSIAGNAAAAHAFRERLFLFSWILGDTWYGLVAMSESRFIPLPAPKVSIESSSNLFHFFIRTRFVIRFWNWRIYWLTLCGMTVNSSPVSCPNYFSCIPFRYFSKFARVDFINHILVGTEPQKKFNELDANLTRVLEEIVVEMKLTDPHLMPTPAEEYTVNCDLLRSRSSTEMEPEEIEEAVQAITKQAEDLVSVSVVSVIHQKAFRNFWIRRFGHSFLIELHELNAVLKDELQSLGEEEADAEQIATLIVGGVARAASTKVDCFVLARHLRCIPPEESDLRTVVRIVSKNFQDSVKAMYPGMAPNNQVSESLCFFLATLLLTISLSSLYIGVL